MSQKLSDSSDHRRRILTFPAVHPCQSISPMTLVASLINLAQNICNYRSKNIVIHRKNLREVIREIGILLIFLEEILERRLDLSHSVFLSFFELHLAFQKLGYLLEDCTREGARLWLLMKSRRISAELRALVTGVATALDVLPRNFLCVSIEVRELVELVAKQAQRGKFSVEQDDERAMVDVILILNKFQGKIAPNPIVLKQVLDHLEIRSWNDCNKEIKFLDDEISIRSSNGDDDKEVVLLCSLMGFLCYCRGVVFDVIDDRCLDRSDTRNEATAEVLSCLNPEDFRCPISLEIMRDPVVISTGQTYDRVSILKWFMAGNHTCPTTGKKLTSTEMVPNSVLQKFIQQYCSSNGIPMPESGHPKRDITQTISAGSPAAAEAMRLLSDFLTYRLAVGTYEDKNKAANEIRLLAKSSIFNRYCLLEAGSIPYLLHLLSSMDSSVQENAIAALLNLSKHIKSKEAIVENGGVMLIVDVLTNGLKMESRQLAAATLFYLSSVEEYRILIGETPEAIKGLVELIRDGTPRGKKNALVAIFSLTLFHENIRMIIEAGAIPLLFDLLNPSDRITDLVNDSLAVLATLAESQAGTKEIISTSSLLLLIGVLHSSPSRSAKEYCVSIILSLCVYGGIEVVSKLQTSSSLMASLYTLLTDGTARASKRATTILNILHEFHNKDFGRLAASSSPTTPEHLVRVW